MHAVDNICTFLAMSFKIPLTLCCCRRILLYSSLRFRIWIWYPAVYTRTHQDLRFSMTWNTIHHRHKVYTTNRTLRKIRIRILATAEERKKKQILSVFFFVLSLVVFLTFWNGLQRNRTVWQFEYETNIVENKITTWTKLQELPTNSETKWRCEKVDLAKIIYVSNKRMLMWNCFKYSSAVVMPLMTFTWIKQFTAALYHNWLS